MTDVMKAATEIFDALPKSVIQTVMESHTVGKSSKRGHMSKAMQMQVLLNRTM